MLCVSVYFFLIYGYNVVGDKQLFTFDGHSRRAIPCEVLLVVNWSLWYRSLVDW